VKIGRGTSQSARQRARSRLLLTILLLLGVNGIESSIFYESANAADAGQKCTKVGQKNGLPFCTKIDGKLNWQFVKNKQTISLQFPPAAVLSAGAFPIAYASTSGLGVIATSASPAICTIERRIVSPVIAGMCVIRLTQAGNSKFLNAITKNITIVIQGDNQISFTPPNSLLLSSGPHPLTGSSVSGLSIVYESLTSDICSVSTNILTPIKIGICTVRASQNGSSLYPVASNIDASITIQGDNQISFTLPSSLLLSTASYLLSGSSTSGLAVTYESLTPDICSVSTGTLTINKVGLCTIRAAQNGSNLYQAAISIDQSVTISPNRVTSDQPDAVTGFQIHAFYVVPADGVDHSYDTNGYIAGILDEGNNFIRSQLGYGIPIDRTSSGYDIQYLKSNLSTAAFQSSQGLTDRMLKDSLALENPGTNRKDYIFFLDVRNLSNSQACGIGNTSGMSSVVAIGTGAECTGDPYNLKNYASSTWLHELFHNFGVDHTLNDPCDLMRGGNTTGTCPANANLTIDKDRTRYVSSSAQGKDIMKLRVWDGHTNDLNLQANCYLNPVPRADGINYAYCPTGTQIIGALKNCWNPINSVTLEEFINGQWQSLGAGGSDSNPWGTQVSWTCGTGYSAPWRQLTVTTPGISLYRWMVNGSESEQFKVIWVR
jgi:hypothetical protein